jgi:hypothetical protein
VVGDGPIDEVGGGRRPLESVDEIFLVGGKLRDSANSCWELEGDWLVVMRELGHGIGCWSRRGCAGGCHVAADCLCTLMGFICCFVGEWVVAAWFRRGLGDNGHWG